MHSSGQRTPLPRASIEAPSRPSRPNRLVLPQLGLAAEKRDTFTRLLGLLMKGRRKGCNGWNDLPRCGD